MIQDKIDRIGPVKLGAGYSINDPKQKRLVPRKRLLAFINLKIKDIDEIKRFCDAYRIIPNNLEEGWLKGITELHTRIKKLVDKSIQNLLTQDDLDLINKEIEPVFTKLVFIDKNEMVDINTNLHGGNLIPQIERSNKDRNIAEIRRFPSPQSTLYWDLVIFIIENRQFRNCQFCANYFLVGRANQIYCDNVCKENAHEKRRIRIRK